jgi:hypothetical protein
VRLLEILFEPRDIWIGVYWTWRRETLDAHSLHVYICVVPMLPIHLQFPPAKVRV